MAIQSLQPSVSIQGSMSGNAETVTSQLSTPITFADGTAVAVTATLSADKTNWDDYSTGGPLTITVSIANNEALAFTAPINVTVTGINNALVEYVDASIASTDNTVGAGTAYDSTTGTLTFSLTADIPALADSVAGSASASFGLQKVTVA